MEILMGSVSQYQYFQFITIINLLKGYHKIASHSGNY
jgi:hypothetical protein